MDILFICTANICRSALAEVILKQKLKESGIEDVEVNSAGIHDYDGSPRDEVLGFYAREGGYEFGGTARYATQAMLESADLIICMEHFHVVEVQKRLPYDNWGNIHTFNEICFNEQSDLIDPYGRSDHDYRYVFDKIQKGCSILAQNCMS